MQKLRGDYWDQIRDVSEENLVFLDETGVNLAMVLLYARAFKGQRAYSKRPEKKGKNVTLIGAMALSGLIASFSFDGATDGDTFLFFVEHVLCPQLWPGAVVVMDNLSAHKVSGVREALAKVGANVVYLSPYSPDFNPIENCWSKLKAALRRMEARTREHLDEAITEVLNLVTLTDIRNWFAHCCYCSTPA